MMNRPTALDVLARAKQLFGPFGIKWTRGMEKRKGLCGENYCSLGAIRQAGFELKANYAVRTQAENYLRSAANCDRIDHWNDSGIRSYTVNKAKETFAILSCLIPGSGKLNYFIRIRPAWCKAIKNAMADEENNLKNGS